MAAFFDQHVNLGVAAQRVMMEEHQPFCRSRKGDFQGIPHRTMAVAGQMGILLVRIGGVGN